MLICTCPIDEDCPATGSGCEYFPWCENLKDDGTEDDNDLQRMRSENVLG